MYWCRILNYLFGALLIIGGLSCFSGGLYDFSGDLTLGLILIAFGVILIVIGIAWFMYIKTVVLIGEYEPLQS